MNLELVLKLAAIQFLATLHPLWLEKERERNRQYRRDNSEASRASVARWAAANKDSARLRAKTWRSKNYERALVVDRSWKAKNKATILKAGRARYYQNIDEYRKKARDWNKAHMGQILEHRRNRRARDPQYAISCRIRNRINETFRRAAHGLRKPDKTINILGCSFAELKLHIEQQFKPGMTWDMVLSGEIHLDHIRPVAKFNLLDPEEVKRCFHFSNLQPLFKLDNLLKRDRVAPEFGNATSK